MITDHEIRRTAMWLQSTPVTIFQVSYHVHGKTRYLGYLWGVMVMTKMHMRMGMRTAVVMMCMVMHEIRFAQ